VAAIATPSTYRVSEGESRVYRLGSPIERVAVGNPEVADYIVINPTELYLLGKKPGATNVIVWDRSGKFTSMPLLVGRNIGPIRDLLRAVLPNETDIQVYASGDAVVLAGSVSNNLAAETAVRTVKGCLGGKVPDDNPEYTLVNKNATANTGPMLAGSIAGDVGAALANMATKESSSISGFVNLLKVRDQQQVRLEVHIAEVSKEYMQALGFDWSGRIGNVSGDLMTGFVSDATLNVFFQGSGSRTNSVDVENVCENGWIKILAKPTLVAISGQEANFLVGGKRYYQTINANGGVDWLEVTYGVGLKFTPTVLDSGRISLKVAPEVSQPPTAESGVETYKTSYASTTVQMKEGQNLVIGGLLRENIIETMKAFPLLGDIPLLGALFRRTGSSSQNTELVVVVRPTLVEASDTQPELPTDRFIPPTQKELFFDGKLQGSRSGQ